MRVRIGTLQPGTSLPLTTPILVSQRLLHQSLRLQLLRQRMARPESRVHQHPKVSLGPQFFLLAILRATAKGKARVVEDRDHLLPKIPPRPCVTSISTKGIASMVTNANTAILNIIGIGEDKGDKGKSGRSATPRRSQTPGGKKDRNCYGWLKGDCQKGDKCTFKHDPSMKGKRAAPSTKTSDAKATPALVRKYDDDIIAKAVPSEKKNKMDVKFNYHVDRHEYVKPDFVECSNRKPRRNLSRAQKQSLTCRTTKEIMDDQQYMLQSKRGMTRARAIGILMDDHGEFSDVDEVHVILGPKNDIKLKINDIEYLENNSRAEMCYEEVIPHVSGKYGRRDNIMCITMPIELKDRRFIMDSGSGHDLISSTRVDRMDIDTYQSDKVNFHTANGITSTSTMVDLDFDTFNEPAKAHVLEDTPSVLSLGKRCMEQGYTFVWPTGREPYMINSEGDKIKMEVHDLIPYVYLGAKDYRPTSDHEAELVMKVLGLMGNNNNASRTIYLDGESGDEMSESDDGVGTYVDGPTKSPRKTKKKRSRRKTVLQQLVKKLMMMTVMNHPSVRRTQRVMMFMLMIFLVRMKMGKTMMIGYQQLMIFQKSINLMKMKLVLSMDHQKKNTMRMISMLTILMEECDCQREVP